MERKIKVLFAVFFLVVLSGIVLADNDTENKTAKNASKNMTYGQCVSEHAVIKNSCYANVKGAMETCKQGAQNATKKDDITRCNQAYKTDKKQCKTVFKGSKKECAKIKHNFLETIGSAFK